MFCVDFDTYVTRGARKGKEMTDVRGVRSGVRKFPT